VLELERHVEGRGAVGSANPDKVRHIQDAHGGVMAGGTHSQHAARLCTTRRCIRLVRTHDACLTERAAYGR
jgi:hypothetical protein